MRHATSIYAISNLEGGFVAVRWQGDAFMIAFHDPKDAISWALVTQQVGKGNPQQLAGSCPL